MQIISQFAPLPLAQPEKGTAVAMGFFDGIHIGHRAVIESAVQWAKEHDAAPAVFTFKLPVVNKMKGKRLLSTADKHALIASLGVEYYLTPDFEEIKGLTPEQIPTMMNYTTLLKADSMYNTPPCWCIYMTGLVMQYLENEIGGLENMQKINAAKAKVLYDYLDGQDFYNNPVEKPYRSMMNVTFTSPNGDLDKAFCAAATEAGFVNLKGHRLVGGMRASIYNAMPPEGIDKLVDFMEKFRKENA